METDELSPLEREAQYWNAQYEFCYGDPPDPLISKGVDMSHVHTVQSMVMRYYVEMMKGALGNRNET